MQGDETEAGSSDVVWPTDKSVQKKLYTSHITNSDTALMVIEYEDGDGDLFRDQGTDGANLFLTTYVYNSNTNQFVIDSLPLVGALKTRYSTYTVLQPANGYYKGKSVQGEIGIPLHQFRTNSNFTILKFEVFMNDMKNHKSNVVTSEAYTLTP